MGKGSSFVFLFSISVILSGFPSLAARKPPPPKIPPKTGGGSVPSAPNPAVKWPMPSNSGGGGGGSPLYEGPHPVAPHKGPEPVIHKPLKMRELPIEEVNLKRRKRSRPPLFVTRYEKIYRSGIFFRTVDNDDTGPSKVTEALLTVQTFLREAMNDALAARHEYENDQQRFKIEEQLYQQKLELYQKKVITGQAYEDAHAQLQKFSAKLEESKGRLAEFEAEVEIGSWKLSELNGSPPKSMVEKAQSYVHLWEARVTKTRGATLQAKAERDYQALAYDKWQTLFKRKIATQGDVLNYQRDYQEAEIVWKLAQKLLEQNTRFLEEAKETAKKAEANESVELPL